MPVVSTSFKPGQSGNPLGRPKNARAVSLEALKFSIEAVHRLVHEMRNADTAPARIAAAGQLLDRAVGKPAQALDHHVIRDIDKMGIEELRELRDRMVSASSVAALEAPDDAEPANLLTPLENEQERELGPKVEVEPTAIDPGEPPTLFDNLGDGGRS